MKYKLEEVSKLRDAFLITFLLGMAFGGLIVGIACYAGWL